jgi:hypothetical protein
MSKLEELKAEKAKAFKVWQEATNILYQTPEYKAESQAGAKALKPWREATNILNQDNVDATAMNAWSEATNIRAKTPESKAEAKAWDALEAARAKLKRGKKMIKLEELKSEEDKALKSWGEASRILNQTPEYKAKAKAVKAWREASNILNQTPEYQAENKAMKAWFEATKILDKATEAKAEAKAWDAVKAARAKLREETK